MAFHDRVIDSYICHRAQNALSIRVSCSNVTAAFEVDMEE